MEGSFNPSFFYQFFLELPPFLEEDTPVGFIEFSHVVSESRACMFEKTTELRRTTPSEKVCRSRLLTWPTEIRPVDPVSVSVTEWWNMSPLGVNSCYY